MFQMFDLNYTVETGMVYLTTFDKQRDILYQVVCKNNNEMIYYL